MGKPERKARERICSSSSSYFLRCFGISRKIQSDRPIVDADQETEKKQKKKTRTCWFLRSTKFRLKDCEITTTPVYETKKQNSNVDDDEQTLFRVIRHVSDRKNIAAIGFKAVEQETKEKDTNEQRDINPDALSFLGYDTCHEHVTTKVRGGKLDPPKTVGSESKPKELRERSSRVGKFDPVIGISIIMLTLVIMLMWGRLCAILCTSTCCYFLPRLKEGATAGKRKHSGGGKAEGGSFPGDLDLNSESYKKKVVLDGFLVRQHRVSL